MVVIVYPIAWGIAILFAAGASALALQQYREEELELGRIELPDYLRGNRDPDLDPDPDRTPPSYTPSDQYSPTRGIGDDGAHAEAFAGSMR